MNLPRFKFSYNKSEILNVILHGGSSGIDSDFMVKIYNKFEKSNDSVVGLNFPYIDRGEEDCTNDLQEELEALESVLNIVTGFKKFKQIRFVAKSLGAIVASHYLCDRANLDECEYLITVLGYVAGSIDLKTFPGAIKIIQGEMDRFGGIEVVKKDMKDAISKSIEFIEIPGVDHSYRNPETKAPVGEGEVVSRL